jgi:TPR repeat protein
VTISRVELIVGRGEAAVNKCCAAEQGNAEAEYYLGDMYCQGKGVTEKNKDEAMKWWQLAATHGHHGATQKLKLNKNCD